jgi:hypothetical protein
VIVSPCRPRLVSGVRALKSCGFFVHFASSTVLRFSYGSVTNQRNQPYVAAYVRAELPAGSGSASCMPRVLGQDYLAVTHRRVASGRADDAEREPAPRDVIPATQRSGCSFRYYAGRLMVSVGPSWSACKGDSEGGGIAACNRRRADCIWRYGLRHRSRAGEIQSDSSSQAVAARIAPNSPTMSLDNLAAKI